MTNIYQKYRKFILIPALVVIMAVFLNLPQVKSVLAEKSVPKIVESIVTLNYGQLKKVLGLEVEEIPVQQVQTVAGGLSCGFDGSAIFNVTNMLPGDTEIKQMTVENTGSVPVVAALKGIRTGPAGQVSPLFETVLDFNILDGVTSVYSDKLKEFFDVSASGDGVELALFNPSESITYDLKVDFPSESGNIYQNKSVIFNLLCGKLTADHVVINEVFYNVDSEHGIDSWKDRGSPARDQKKGQSDEWVELYNPTANDISLKNWTLTDNSGGSFTIHSNTTIKAGGFALIAKDQSVWKYWDENASAVKIQSDNFLGDGLDNSGDHIVLRNSAGEEVDFVRWGNDNTSGFNWTEDVNDPSAASGASIERIAPGFDNNLSSDWVSDTSHIPTP